MNYFLKSQGSLLSCLLQHLRGNNFATASVLKLLVQSFDGRCCHNAFISGRIQSSSYFSAETRYRSLYPSPTLWICSHYKTWWKSGSRVPTIGRLVIEGWKTQQWLVLCVQSLLCWIQLRIRYCLQDLVSLTAYYQWHQASFNRLGTLSQCVSCDQYCDSHRKY